MAGLVVCIERRQHRRRRVARPGSTRSFDGDAHRRRRRESELRNRRHGVLRRLLPVRIPDVRLIHHVVPFVGWDREDAASIVERLRGRTTGRPAFARSHHAGPVGDHIGRYRLLADRGVTTVFVSLPDLTGPQDVLRLAPVAAAFA